VRASDCAGVGTNAVACSTAGSVSSGSARGSGRASEAGAIDAFDLAAAAARPGVAGARDAAGIHDGVGGREGLGGGREGVGAAARSRLSLDCGGGSSGSARGSGRVVMAARAAKNPARNRTGRIDKRAQLPLLREV